MILNEFKTEIEKIDKTFKSFKIYGDYFKVHEQCPTYISLKIKNEKYSIIFVKGENIILRKWSQRGYSIKEIMQDTAEKVLLKIKQLNRE